ncbi:hypothetical protein F511_20424 [Dorcoceras hygrometricum]|uniref:Uncharacterized protein n=1 Tax=Dorcoceras hygrometricum TaxID=472368 RepID=A0A2Z7ASJ8_9LAMI|nr:hypothetical protein F511_20424 [Dorcoceras hygrometricum]
MYVRVGILGPSVRGGACLTAGAVSIPLEISLTLLLPSALSQVEIVLPVKIWHHTFYSPHGQPDQATQRQQLDVRELPRRGGACLTAGAVSIPLEISLTLPLPPSLSPAEIVLSIKIWHHTFYSPHDQPDQAAQRQQLYVRELPRRLVKIGYYPLRSGITLFIAHMANQIKRHNVSSLTYENFPGGYSSQSECIQQLGIYFRSECIQQLGIYFRSECIQQLGIYFSSEYFQTLATFAFDSDVTI